MDVQSIPCDWQIAQRQRRALCGSLDQWEDSEDSPDLDVRCRRQRSEQYLTCSQHAAHFLRHKKGRKQTTHTLCGRCVFFMTMFSFACKAFYSLFIRQPNTPCSPQRQKDGEARLQIDSKNLRHQQEPEHDAHYGIETKQQAHFEFMKKAR